MAALTYTTNGRSAEKAKAKPEKPKRRTPLKSGELQELAESLVSASEFTLRDTEYKERRALVHRARKVVIPGVDIPEAAQWRSHEISRDGHLYVRTVLGARMQIHVSALREGVRAETRAARVGDYLQYLDTDFRSRRIYQPCLYDVATVGVGVLHPIIKPEAMPPRPDREKDEDPVAYMKRIEQSIAQYKGCPFDLERIKPETMYWEPDFSVMLQKAEVPVRAINRIYERKGKAIAKVDGQVRLIPASQGQNANDAPRRQETVTLISMEDEDWCYRLVYGDGGPGKSEVLDVYPNYFSEPSYVLMLGDLTGETDALNFSEPWLMGKYQTVPFKNLFGTVMMVAGIRTGQQRYQLVWKGDPNTKPNVGVEDIRVEGEVIDVPPGFELVSPKIELGYDVTAAAQWVEQSDNYGFPRELANPMEIDASSGFEQALVTDTVHNLMDEPLARWTEALRKVFTLIIKAQVSLDLPVKVRSARISTREPDSMARVNDEISVEAEDLEEVDISLEFDATTQYSQIAQAEQDLKTRSEGLMTDSEWLRRNRGIDDSSTFYRLKDRDEMRLFARTLAMEDAKRFITAARNSVLRQAQKETKLADPLADAGAGALEPPPQEEITPSIATSPNTAMPLTPPMPDELMGPNGQTGAGMVGP